MILQSSTKIWGLTLYFEHSHTGLFHGNWVKASKVYQRALWSMQMITHCFLLRCLNSLSLSLSCVCVWDILTDNRERWQMQSLRGALLAACYSSAILSGISAVGLVLLGGRLKSKDEWSMFPGRSFLFRLHFLQLRWSLKSLILSSYQVVLLLLSYIPLCFKITIT